MAMVAGILAGDSLNIPISYDLFSKVDDVCNNPSATCADLAHSISIYSVPQLLCAAKGITTACPGLGKLITGQGYVPRDLQCCAALGNYVWIDDNKDGVQDPGEMPVAGVTVTLYDENGKAIASTVTDAYGKYLFEDLTPGTYSVGFTPPTNYEITSQGNGTTATGSDANPLTGRTAPVTLGDGEVNLDIDCGLIQSSDTGQNVGDYVWFDTNQDGVQDPGEAGIAGVTVTLYDASGKVIGTTITDQNGYYNFPNVPAGTGYTVGFTPPIGLIGSPQTSGTATGSDMNPTTFKTAPFDVTDGQDRTDIDAGFYPQPNTTASLGNLVWNDLNNDGIQDADEPGVAGVTVTLYDGIGSPIATTVTDAYGNYVFNNLAPGDYSVGFSNLPTGFQFSPQNTGGLPSDSMDSDANTSTGLTGTYTLAAGDKNMSVDAGIYSPTNSYTLGNYVWIDDDKDGIQDANETGVPGVMIILRDNAGNPIDTTYTDKDGKYLFTNLPAGTYSVQAVNYPNGYSITTADQGGNDNADSDANSQGITSTVTLGSGNPDDRSLDIGLIAAPQNNYTATLGDKIWFDGNNDGIQDPDEPGILGVTVYLYSADGVTILDSTVTDAKGNYIFTGLNAGDYVVGVKLPPSYIVSPKGAGSDSALDANGNAAVGGITKSDAVSLSAGEDDLTIDFGISKPSALIVGDKVWLDANKDGIQDTGEPGVPGIGVKLVDEYGNVIATTTTDENGNYLFVDVPPGDYKIQFTNLPSGYVFTAKDTATAANDFVDSDVDPNTGKTDLFTVDGTYTWTSSTTSTQRSYDAGIYPELTAAVSGTYWVDENGDGIQDPTEPVIPGMRVTLYDNLGNPVASTITDANGNYLFPNVTPGTGYTIGFEAPPTGTQFTQQNSPGTIAGTSNSDANISTGKTAPFDLFAGDIVPHVDAGVETAPLGSIGDKVWFDNDYNGIQDPSEAGVPGVVMELLDAAGNVIATTVTDGNGNYLFSNLPPGDYKVRMGEVPVGYMITRSDVGSDDAADNDFNKINKTTGTISLNSGENRRDIDAGISPVNNSAIGNFVWHDDNIDGIPNSGELAAAGVTVILYDSLTNTAIDSVVTNSTGYFLFDSLPPGSYKLKFVYPGYKPTYQNTTNNTKDDFDSDADTTTGFTVNYNLGVNDTNSTVWAGFIPAATPLNSNFLSFNAKLSTSLVDYFWIYSETELTQHYEIWRGSNNSNFEKIAHYNASQPNSSAGYFGIDNLSSESPGIYYYTVYAVNSNGTKQQSKIIAVNYNTNNISNIVIAPNPAQNNFNIFVPNGQDNKSTVRIYAADGKLVVTVEGIDTNCSIETNNWSNGVYTVQVIQNNNLYTQKLVINK